MDINLINILRLFRSKNIGIQAFYYLIYKYNSPRVALENLNQLVYKWRGKPISLCGIEDAEREIHDT